MGKEDGLIIKDRLMEHLNGISDLDLWFSEYYFYQYRWCHGLVKSIDIRANEGLEAAKNFVELISKQFPQTVEEAVEEIVSNMDEKQIENVLNCSKQEFISNNHFGIGLFIRNNYGAYNKKGIKLRADIAGKGGPTFPADSMSGYLVGELWEYVNSKFQGSE